MVIYPGCPDMDSRFRVRRVWHSRERLVEHHWRAEVAEWITAEVNVIRLKFCIQTRALDTVA